MSEKNILFFVHIFDLNFPNLFFSLLLHLLKLNIFAFIHRLDLFSRLLVELKNILIEILFYLLDRLKILLQVDLHKRLQDLLIFFLYLLYCFSDGLDLSL